MSPLVPVIDIDKWALSIIPSFSLLIVCIENMLKERMTAMSSQ